jgi:hypothetical protein
MPVLSGINRYQAVSSGIASKPGLPSPATPDFGLRTLLVTLRSHAPTSTPHPSMVQLGAIGCNWVQLAAIRCNQPSLPRTSDFGPWGRWNSDSDEVIRIKIKIRIRKGESITLHAPTLRRFDAPTSPTPPAGPATPATRLQTLGLFGVRTRNIYFSWQQTRNNPITTGVL